MWQEDIDSNLASVEASRVAETRHESGWMDQFHSDDFLVYAYLQSGQEAQAKAVAAASAAEISHHESNMKPDNYMHGMFPYYRVKFPVFIALETHDWKAAATLDVDKADTPESKLLVYWARTIANGHLHQARQARSDLAAYDAIIEELKKGDEAWEATSTGRQIDHGALLSWAAFAEGNTAESLRQMRASADLQDKVGQGEVDIQLARCSATSCSSWENLRKPWLNTNRLSSSAPTVSMASSSPAVPPRQRATRA
jgi:hypothetical protein